MKQPILWLCLFVAATVQQVSSSDQLTTTTTIGQIRDVAAVIDGGPLKTLSFIEKSITKDIDLLARELEKQYMPPDIHTLDDIELCIQGADRLIGKYIEMFSSNRVTKKRIDERNSIERASALLMALPVASESCDLVSYLDLMAIFKAASGDSNLSHQPKDPVRSSIVAAMKLHRDHCSGGYRARLMEAYRNGIGTRTKETVSKLFDSSLIEQIFPGYAQDQMVLFESENTLESLVKVADPLVARLIDQSAIKGDIAEDRFSTEILSNQLLEPCKAFIAPLEEVLLPAKADMALTDTTLSGLALSDRESTDIWARFHICSSIHYNEPTIVNRLKAGFLQQKSML